jgi:hypothetical protein
MDILMGEYLCVRCLNFILGGGQAVALVLKSSFSPLGVVAIPSANLVIAPILPFLVKVGVK